MTTVTPIGLFAAAKGRVDTEPTMACRAHTVKTRRDFNSTVMRFIEARDALEEAKTEHAMAREELEDICIDKWVEHSKENGSPSGTITLHTRGEDATEVRVIPTTRFTKMDESTANYLRENGYADLIVEETSYSLNPKILSKYMKEISDAIQRCKKIPQEDKDRLFKATTKYKVNNKMCGDKRFSLKKTIQDLGRIFMFKCPKKKET